MNRIGPKMSEVLMFVQTYPGCTPMSAAAHVGPHGSLKYGYAAVNRTIEAGLVVAVERSDKKGCYRLYTPDLAELSTKTLEGLYSNEW